MRGGKAGWVGPSEAADGSKLASDECTGLDAFYPAGARLSRSFWLRRVPEPRARKNVTPAPSSHGTPSLLRRSGESQKLGGGPQVERARLPPSRNYGLCEGQWKPLFGDG
jgi:hypothetical protein